MDRPLLWPFEEDESEWALGAVGALRGGRMGWGDSVRFLFNEDSVTDEDSGLVVTSGEAIALCADGAPGREGGGQETKR